MGFGVDLEQNGDHHSFGMHFISGVWTCTLA